MATLGDLAADMARQGLEFARREPQQEQEQARDTQPVLIVTTNEAPGYRITQDHGDVFGLIVRASNTFSNMGAQLRTLAGGEVAGYTRRLTDSRNQARQRMWREARARGANAVVAMRFDCNEIGDIMSEVATHGTAVTVESVQPSLPRTSPDGERAARAGKPGAFPDQRWCRYEPLSNLRHPPRPTSTSTRLGVYRYRPVSVPGGPLCTLEPWLRLNLEISVVGVDCHEEVVQEAF
jgi:uncharacterized protein YbjQ (UPF0145 family)